MHKQEVVPMLVALGRFIRQRRIALNLSQEELAERAGLHRTYVSDVERGIRNLTIGAVWFIAHGLELELRDMVLAMDKAVHPDVQIPPPFAPGVLDLSTTPK